MFLVFPLFSQLAFSCEGLSVVVRFCYLYLSPTLPQMISCSLFFILVNVPKLVRTFRKHRKFTVQKKVYLSFSFYFFPFLSTLNGFFVVLFFQEQYEFCYRAILFYANQFIQLGKNSRLVSSHTSSQDILVMQRYNPERII